MTGQKTEGRAQAPEQRAARRDNEFRRLSLRSSIDCRQTALPHDLPHSRADSPIRRSVRRRESVRRDVLPSSPLILESRVLRRARRYRAERKRRS